MSVFNFIFSLKSFFLLPASFLIFAAAGEVTSVDMSPSSLILRVGATAQIQATARDANGQVVPGVVFQWSSRNINVVTVDQSGNVTGVAVGTTSVVATAPNGVHNPVIVTVSAATPTPTPTPTPNPTPTQVVAFVQMSPASLNLQVGATSQIQATARDANGQVVQGIIFQWSSRNTNVASVNQLGNVTGVAVGTTSVVAIAPNGVHNPAIVTVVPANSTPTPTATPTATPTMTPTPIPTPTPPASGRVKGGFGVKEITFNLNGNYHNPFENVRIRVTWTAPDSSAIVTNGFYYSPGVYKARFAPNQSGTWNWTASIVENNGTPTTQTGSLVVGQQISGGFVKRNPANNFRWLNDDGTPFNPVGIVDCVNEYPRVGDGIKMTMDGGTPLPEFPQTTLFVNIDTYFSAYGNGTGNQRFNLFRWSIRNCSFDLKESLNASGNYYNARNGILGDEFIGKIKQYGMKLQLVLFNGATVDTSPAGLRYIQYCIDRYGAFVDFWEVTNESSDPESVITAAANYIKANDPYAHPVSSSFVYGPTPQVRDIAALDFTSPHLYEPTNPGNEFIADSIIANRILEDGKKTFGKPIVYGEWGNNGNNYDSLSALRMRLTSWTAFFNEASLIFWNSTDITPYPLNIYLGPEERGYIQVFQSYVRDFPAAQPTFLTINNPNLVRGYALTSPDIYGSYLHAFTNHATATSGITITIDVPRAGVATWTNPSTGAVLRTQSVSTGVQTLSVPPFVIDAALKIR